MATLVLVGCMAALPAGAAERLRVVATFTILGDMARAVAGDDAVVTTLVGPDGDAHVYEPTPADVRAIAGADVIIQNGLGFEGWIERLVRASDTRAIVIVASAGIAPLHGTDPADAGRGHRHDRAAGHGSVHDHDHGHGRRRVEGAAADPHAWQDLENGRTYVANIARAFSAADPARSEIFVRRARDYAASLADLDHDIRDRLNAIPAARRRVICSHDAFGYFARAYGVEFSAPLGFATSSEASAGEMAALVRQIRASGIRALFVENMTDPRIVQQLARETGAVVGGTLYSDSLSGPDGPASTYIDMFRHNVSEILRALAR